MNEFDDVYCRFGTPLVNEETGTATRKPMQDRDKVRALPIHMQEPTDDQGRKRFHGAFSGGFSAGYYNTVGSKEGWAPSSFKSSRSERREVKASTLDEILDEDELEERKRTHLHAKDDYDTFGAVAAGTSRREALMDSHSRPSILPGGPSSLLSDILVPVANSIGMRLLTKMGWRPGRGVGQSQGVVIQAAGSRWGTVSGVSLENTPIYVLVPKRDSHGLGFDPFVGAEEFRQAKEKKEQVLNQRLQSSAAGTFSGLGPSRGGGSIHGTKRNRGIAFGSGVLDEDPDALEDYADDMYEGQEGVSLGSQRRGGSHRPGGEDGQGIDEMEEDERPRLAMKGIGALFSQSQRSLDPSMKGLPSSGVSGSRALALAKQGFSYQLVEEEDEDEEEGGAGKQLLLGGGGLGSRPMLQSAQDVLRGKGGDFLPGFKRGDDNAQAKIYPPPTIPSSFTSIHTFSRPRIPTSQPPLHPGSSSNSNQDPNLPPPPPPSNPELRRDVDSLAALVARSGQAIEDLARRQVEANTLAASSAIEGGGKEGGVPILKFSFLLPLLRASNPMLAQAWSCYQWRLGMIRRALASIPGSNATMQSMQLLNPGGQRLTIGERIALLGEVPLPSSAPSLPPPPPPPLSLPPPPLPLPPPLLLPKSLPSPLTMPGISSGDKNRLTEALKGSFVRGSNQDMTGSEQKEQIGLRPGAASAAAAAALLASFSDRFASSSKGDEGTQKAPSTDPASNVLLSQELRKLKTEIEMESEPSRPVRTFDDWRPDPLLCRRLNVPDPYQGQVKEEPVPLSSRFKSERVMLMEAALPAPPPLPMPLPPFSDKGIVLPPPPPFPSGPPPSFSMPPPPRGLPPPPFPLPGPPPHFFSGPPPGFKPGPSQSSAQPPVLQQDKRKEIEEEILITSRPLDLFKAIFEDDEDDEGLEKSEPSSDQEPKTEVMVKVPTKEDKETTNAPPPTNALAEALAKARDLTGRHRDVEIDQNEPKISGPKPGAPHLDNKVDDPELQKRILEALKTLAEVKHNSKGSIEERRRKKKSKHKDKKSKKHKKEKKMKQKEKTDRRRRSPSPSSSSDSA